MDTAKWISLGSAVVAVICSSATLEGSFAIDRPVLSSALGSFSIGCLLILTSKCRSFLRARTRRCENELVELRVLPKPNGSRDPSPDPVDREESKSSTFRDKKVLLLVTAISIRVLCFQKLLEDRRCAVPGIEGFAPIMLALVELRHIPLWSSGERNGSVPRTVTKILRGILMSILRHMGPAMLVSSASVYISTVVNNPGSTFICPRGISFAKWTPWLQWISLLLDCLILTKIRNLLSLWQEKKTERSSAGASILGAVFLCTSIVFFLIGAIVLRQKPEFRDWAFSIDGAYFRSLGWLVMISLMILIPLIRLMEDHSVLDIVLFLSFTYSYYNILASCWTNSSYYIPGIRLTIFSATLLLFIGTLSIIYFRKAEKSTPFAIQVLSRCPRSLLLLLFVLPLIVEFSSNNFLAFHPIDRLIIEAGRNHDAWRLRAGQSKTLKEAVHEYRRRYDRNPPPGFDMWYEYATKRSSIIIDDYDNIHEDLLPFWALEPKIIRERTKDVISNKWNEAGEIIIRSGKAEVRMDISPDHRWMLEGVCEMINKFGKWLPDMDLAFNVNDESRVAVPYKDLEKLRKEGRNAGGLDLDTNREWSSDRAASWEGEDHPDPPESPFVNFSFKRTFHDFGSIACPPNSAARKKYIWDPSTLCTKCAAPHSLGPFISNWTLSASPCHQPDLANLHGFYLSPSAFKTSRPLVPVFSQSKVHGYADILYPSPWNYMDKVIYNSTLDTLPFSAKQNTLFWRGTTSEGVANYGTWKGMNRQRLVHMVTNSTFPQPILLPHPTKPTAYKYQPLLPTVFSPEAPNLHNLTVDIRFVDVGIRCAPRDCEDQKQTFALAESTDFQSHWSYKYLMDVDGAGFSGRFLPFLSSKSLPFKSALFREWYDPRITAWLHFVPVDLRLHDLLSSLVYFGGWVQGKDGHGERIAMAGREWASQVLRKEDMEIYFFRVLLEWGRLTDDRREELGFWVE